MTRTGFLIALEGIDGCGKSLQTRLLVEALRERGHAVAAFREPGDSEAGRELRRIFVEGRDVTPEQELDLFVRDRRVDVRDNIEPALARGEVVVMDRYYLSSVVYQGALGLDPEAILELHRSFAPEPDLTILLDIDPETAHERIEAARGGVDSFEEREYLERVRALYLEQLGDERVVRVDASPSPERVHREVMERTLERLPGPDVAS